MKFNFLFYTCSMKTQSLFGLFILIGLNSFSQIELVKDPRVDGLIEKQREISPPATATTMPGYRVQLTFESSKSEIDNARSRFVSQYPKIDTYVEFKAPYFFLKVGDFRTHLEAEKIKNEVMPQFPTCMIIKENINLPRIEQ